MTSPSFPRHIKYLAPLLLLVSIVATAGAQVPTPALVPPRDIQVQPGEFRILPPVEIAESPRPFQLQARLAFQPPPLASPQLPLEIPSPQVPQVTLTLAELEQMALRHNPAVGRAVAQVRAFRGDYVQAGLYPNPTVAYSGEEMGDGGTAGKQGGFIGQEFVTAGKRRFDCAVANSAVTRAQEELNAARLRVLTDVRTAFYETLVAQQRIEITKQLVAVAQEAHKTAQALMEAKEASLVDVLQSQIEVDSAGILLSNAEHKQQASRRILATAVGMPQLPEAMFRGDLNESCPCWSWEEALNHILAESPQLSAARAEINRARWAVQRACAGRIPNVNLRTGLHRENTTGDTLAGVEFEMALPIFNRNQGNIMRANAELISARRDLSRIELYLQRRLAEVFEHYASTRHQVDKYRQVILPNAKKSLDLVTGGYQQGEFGYLTLLMAQRTYFQSNLAYIESLSELKSATASIEGLLLKDSLGSGN
jgi:cobalt-zinc-cadmium efflux system outer membrane protein